ncbi:hypothetical protein LUZ61_016084 [Rhynchospora tenuis]|uniref:tRNAHis guanylyltransferase catalytic domain-containing protein n=1 Tax=Rhynchospora tenuis TaxID=198213 RepID=A0AAD5Z4U8_9POAL|nr:hypothetical protein LUZ61_016084 [Rhynchospora tenuis]
MIPVIIKNFGTSTPISFMKIAAWGTAKFEYVKNFKADDRLPPSNWIIVRIHGCDFHCFSSIHEFEKPNDSNAASLMNSCASSLREKFPAIVFAYGVSDEYSFVFEESEFCERQASEIVSSFVSYFGSAYVMKWKEFLPDKDLKEVPYFKGRAVCCPKAKIVRDYLACRQFDCMFFFFFFFFFF